MQKSRYTCILYGLLYYGIISFCSTACAPEPPPTLSKKSKATVDTLYRETMKALQPEIDSLCDLETQKIMEMAVDSILQERLKERKERLGY